MILEWNMNGLKRDIDDLKHLVRSKNYKILAVEETHSSPEHDTVLAGYSSYRYDHTLGGKASGGVAIFVKDTVYSERVQIRSTLQAVACTVYTPFRLTMCNIHLPPSDRVDRNHLQDLLTQLPRPLMFLGDLDARSTLWNSNTTNTSGRIIEDILDTNDLIPLNVNSATHLFPRTGTFSNIDVSSCSPDIFTRFIWNVKQDPYNSDHFPIEISIQTLPQLFDSPVRFNAKKANWTKYQQCVIGHLNLTDIESIQDFNE